MAEKEPFTFTMANADEDIPQIIKKLKPEYPAVFPYDMCDTNVSLYPSEPKEPMFKCVIKEKKNVMQKVRERLIDIMGDLYESKFK